MTYREHMIYCEAYSYSDENFNNLKLIMEMELQEHYLASREYMLEHYDELASINESFNLFQESVSENELSIITEGIIDSIKEKGKAILTSIRKTLANLLRKFVGFINKIIDKLSVVENDDEVEEICEEITTPDGALSAEQAQAFIDLYAELIAEFAAASINASPNASPSVITGTARTINTSATKNDNTSNTGSNVSNNSAASPSNSTSKSTANATAVTNSDNVIEISSSDLRNQKITKTGKKATDIKFENDVPNDVKLLVQKVIYLLKADNIKTKINNSKSEGLLNLEGIKNGSKNLRDFIKDPSKMPATVPYNKMSNVIYVNFKGDAVKGDADAIGNICNELESIKESDKEPSAEVAKNANETLNKVSKSVAGNYDIYNILIKFRLRTSQALKQVKKKKKNRKAHQKNKK